MLKPMDLALNLGSVEIKGPSLAARGEMRPESDIDIMLEFEPGVHIGLIGFESLAGELESLAGRRVDLVTKRGLKPWVRPRVLKDARVIYAA
jgi:hypothetical protein